MAKQRKPRTRRREKKGGPGSTRRKPCPYCRDKIRSRRITGACRRHQSQIARAVKRARELALLPYTADQATTLRGGAPERPERGERER